MVAKNKSLRTLSEIKQLEEFLRDLIPELVKRQGSLIDGADVTKYAQSVGHPVPNLLRGTRITWDTHRDFGDIEGNDAAVLVLLGPGHPDVLGLTIGCIRFGKVKVCLECGWFYCRIVIKGSF